MFPKSKRFHDSVPQAPPVGSYEVKIHGKGSTASFGKGKRFGESKESAPGSTDISLLNVSSCSTSSRNDSKCGNSQFVTPLPFRKTRNPSSSTPNMKEDAAKKSALEKEISRLLYERVELENRLAATQQDVQKLESRLQSLVEEKVIHESSIAGLQKEVRDLRQGNDLLQTKVNSSTNKKIESLEGELRTVTTQLQEKDGVLSSLRLTLNCGVKNMRADLHLEQERNKTLNERIAYLEKTNAELANDRDEVEEANQTLHDLVAQLQRENIHLKEQLDEAEHDLEVIRTKMETTMKESHNKILTLEEKLSKEIMKSQEFGEKLECSLKQSGNNFDEAQARIKQLQEVNENLETKVQDLEGKLFELIEREPHSEERARYLAVDKDSLESRLHKCESDYEQRLSIANDQVDSLQQELQRYEEMMTQNLRSMTDKYQDLEESYTCLQSETDKEKQLILAELEATKKCLLESRQECDQQQTTCVFLKRQNEQLEVEEEELNQQLQSLKEETKSMRDDLSKTKEEAELTKTSLRTSLEEAHKTMKDLYQREETLSQELQLVLSNKQKQENELETFKEHLNRVKSETKESESRLQDEVQRHQLEVTTFEERLKEMEETHDRQIKQVEEKAAKTKEEFGRRLVETQKKLSQTEINFAKFKSEQENITKVKDKDTERKLNFAEEKVNKLKLELFRQSENDELIELKAQAEMWQTKFEDLQRKVEPFKDQLDEYEAERNALLSQNNEAKDEVAKLGHQYARLLGHQNKKQKIHHVIKLKEENVSLKAEITKLRDQAEKQKRSAKKLEEKLDQVSGKKRFNPAEAFSHNRKENLPLSVISNGNGTVNM